MVLCLAELSGHHAGDRHDTDRFNMNCSRRSLDDCCVTLCLLRVAENTAPVAHNQCSSMGNPWLSTLTSSGRWRCHVCASVRCQRRAIRLQVEGTNVQDVVLERLHAQRTMPCHAMMPKKQHMQQWSHRCLFDRESVISISFPNVRPPLRHGP